MLTSALLLKGLKVGERANACGCSLQCPLLRYRHGPLIE